MTPARSGVQERAEERRRRSSAESWLGCCGGSVTAEKRRRKVDATRIERRAAGVRSAAAAAMGGGFGIGKTLAGVQCLTDWALAETGNGFLGPFLGSPFVFVEKHGTNNQKRCFSF
jgi:hypothetical protein